MPQNSTRRSSVAVLLAFLAGCSSTQPVQSPASATSGSAADTVPSNTVDESSRFFQDWLRTTFADHLAAIDRGQDLLKSMKSRDHLAPGMHVGRTVAFVGGRTRDFNCDLMTDEGVRLRITLRPNTDVLPESILWTAGVLGTVREIDMEDMTISIDARPDDWRLCMTW